MVCDWSPCHQSDWQPPTPCVLPLRLFINLTHGVVKNKQGVGASCITDDSHACLVINSPHPGNPPYTVVYKPN